MSKIAIIKKDGRNLNQVLANRILKELKSAGAQGLSYSALSDICRASRKATGKKGGQREFRECLQFLISKGDIMDNRTKIFAVSELSFIKATVSKLNKTFGFVRVSEDDSEMFIPGRYLMGALPGDKVLVSPIESHGESPEGEIVKITHEGNCTLSGTVIKEGMSLCVMPDNMVNFPFSVPKNERMGAKEGDKVSFTIVKRGMRHNEHEIKILAVYGDSQTAQICTTAMLDINGIKQTFPEDVEAQAAAINQNGISEKEIAKRLDLREERIFTIDGADTKDIDDAVSLKKLGDYYELGVHIADVSYYVKASSAIDNEAFLRGTSIYFADRVIPMLPKALSNGICSLNEGVDRLAFSCMMTLDKSGELIDYEFRKSVIRSRVKGVYNEINELLSSTDNDALMKKYKPVYESLVLMKELANILTKNKLKRGAPEIETSESYLILNEKGVTVDILPRERGESEVMIEEFMLTANEAAASAARLKEIPFVYRVHEPPSPQKLESLKSVFEILGLETKNIKPDMQAIVLSKALAKAKGKPIFPLVNRIVLRSMSKAKYYEKPLGHYGLVLKDYAQFTSPIRRYPDLTIHRILSEVANGMPLPKVRGMFEKEVVRAAARSTETELFAMKLERDCDDCYKAEYMKSHLSEDYDALISYLAPQGIYCELPNSVEGLIKHENMPQGEYDFENSLEFIEKLSGKTYRVGDAIKVKCIKADVSNGRIDFAII